MEKLSTHALLAGADDAHWFAWVMVVISLGDWGQQTPECLLLEMDIPGIGWSTEENQE